MKLTFKDLKQQKFEVEAEPSETIGQVKEKISEAKGWETSQQKLIYSGTLPVARLSKILQDANTVESYNIEEKGFIVCMYSKPKAAPASSSSSAKAPSTPAPSTAQTPAPPAAPAPSLSTTANPPSTPSPAPAGSTVPTSTDAGNFNDPSALTLGPQREAAIQNMESMGFPRAEIDRAMRAAYFNPDRAVEYLLNQLRQVVQTQPQMLEPILQQVGAGNPQLAQLIQEHPDQFLQLLSEEGDNDAPAPPGTQEVFVNEEEREAIERLCRLGFERDMVIQAYFACDKNEELAANFLFEQPPEDEEN
ncbi:MAG: hypothetical protein Q9193_000273 [Seirophora villosa]